MERAECGGTAEHGEHNFNGGAYCPGNERPQPYRVIYRVGEDGLDCQEFPTSEAANAFIEMLEEIREVYVGFGPDGWWNSHMAADDEELASPDEDEFTQAQRLLAAASDAITRLRLLRGELSALERSILDHQEIPRLAEKIAKLQSET